MDLTQNYFEMHMLELGIVYMCMSMLCAMMAWSSDSKMYSLEESLLHNPGRYRAS